MKDAFLFLLLAVVAYLIYDDYSKRDALKQMQTQVQQLALERDQARRGAVSYAPRIQPTPASPGWFQERLSQKPALDESVRQTRDAKHYASPTPH
jgi:hypothetical protein